MRIAPSSAPKPRASSSPSPCSSVFTSTVRFGAIRGISCRREDADVFFTFSSFLDPGAVYHLDLSAFTEPDAADAAAMPAPRLVRRSTVSGLDVDAFVTKQVFVPSADGTRVPMFIIHARDFVADGSAPCLCYAYGGFNISLTPSFSTSKMCAVRSYGACYAVANLRGGGEYGETWHKAGALANKQNVFDDFTACARYLVQHGYTSAPRLTIEGGSNGGLLVAAVANQSPSLFGAAIAHVGVHDMLRFHRFSIGRAWCTEYGNAEESAEDFAVLRAYSPLHNVRLPPPAGGQHPAMLLLTGTHDDRVSPLHSLKLAATLQAAAAAAGGAQTAPIVARIDVKSGHGAGKPTQKVIDEVADVYAFMAKAVGATWRD